MIEASPETVTTTKETKDMDFFEEQTANDNESFEPFPLTPNNNAHPKEVSKVFVFLNLLMKLTIINNIGFIQIFFKVSYKFFFFFFLFISFYLYINFLLHIFKRI